MRGRAIVAVALGFAALQGGPVRSDDNWPQFRGPTGLGYTGERNLPIAWGGAGQENVRWKAPVVGRGLASPIVWGQRLLACTGIWEGKLVEHHVLCYDTRDGKLLWDTPVPPGPLRPGDIRGLRGEGYAGPTPTTDGKLVFCVFGSAVMAALDLEGKIVWRKELIPCEGFDVIVGSSPILYQDMLIYQFAMNRKQDSKVVAYDKQTGAVKWEQKMPYMDFAHSTPVIIDVKGKPQMLIASAGCFHNDPAAMQGLDPADGKRIWWCWGQGEVTTPAVGAGIVYFDSGRGGGPGVAVDPNGQGDVTKTHTRWKLDQVGSALSSPIVVGDYLYRLHDSGVLKCWKAATGTQVYAEKLKGLSSKWASPVADPSGNIFFANGGTSLVIKAGPEFKLLATNELGDNNHASPAVAGGKMFLLGAKDLYCIGKP
jgi:outer membrane protein assembly factor BamB